MHWVPSVAVQLRNPRWGLCALVLSGLIVGGCSTSELVTEGQVVDRGAEAEYRRQYQAFVVDCLTEAGFPSELMPDGSVKSVHGDHYDDYIQAGQVCDKTFGPLPSAVPPGAEELSRFYDLQIESYECLIERGHQPKAPPSRETYIELFPTDNAWDAYLPSREGDVLIEDPACPRPQFEDIKW